MGKDTLEQLHIDHLRVVGGSEFRLDNIDPEDTCGLEDKKSSKKLLKGLSKELNKLQEIMYAQGKYAVLIVLQAMDTGGKDSTIRRVLGPLNPQGIRVTSFKKPTEEEIARGYLWRIQQKVPRKGMIRVFNRSHYEDVLVVRVRDLAPAEEVEKRYQQINDFEKYLTENRVVVLKFMLHISKKEQKERLLRRLHKKDKHWKFNTADLKERRKWPSYMEAFQIALSRCSTEDTPWYVIPANRRWARDVIIAKIIKDHLEALDLQYPPAEEGLDKVVIDD